MAYISTVNDENFRIDAGENLPQREITLDGQTHALDWRQIAQLIADTRTQGSIGGRYSLLLGGRSYEVYARKLVNPDENDGQTYEIYFDNQRFEVHVEDEREKTLSNTAKAGHTAGEASIRAPMPGLVLRLPFEPGDKITRGQTVAVLEAMKMENDLGAPISGSIKELRVKQGQTVNQGDVLVVVKGE
jgi:biotin carboxyl carrier protein